MHVCLSKCRFFIFIDSLISFLLFPSVSFGGQHLYVIFTFSVVILSGTYILFFDVGRKLRVCQIIYNTYISPTFFNCSICVRM